MDWEAFLLARLQAGLVQKRWRDRLWGEGAKGSLQPRHLSEDRGRATGRKKTRRAVKRRTVEEWEEDGRRRRRRKKGWRLRRKKTPQRRRRRCRISDRQSQGNFSSALT